MGERKSRADWEGIVASFEGSGLTVARFCSSRRLKPKALRWWQWKLAREARSATSVRLVPVGVVESTVSATRTPLELVLGDIAIRFEAGTEPEYLAALVSALRGRC